MTYIPNVETGYAAIPPELLESFSMLIPVLTAYLTVILIVVLALTVLMIVSTWIIFRKAGTGGWKSLIPIYCDYTFFKIAWKRRYFFLSIILILLSVVASNYLVLLVPEIPPILFSIIPLILDILVVIIEIKLHVKIARAFRKRGGFAVGLIFLPFIFFPILAFGRAKYRKRKRRRKALPEVQA